jgi:hypothetical protein
MIKINPLHLDGTSAGRKPRLLCRLPGQNPRRLAARQLEELLSQEPSQKPRLSPETGPTGSVPHLQCVFKPADSP